MSRPRISGGSAKGRAIETPDSGTRPSPARLREALFDILAFEGRAERGTRGAFVDLFSGSGAVGLEAASRGWQVTCVELRRPAVAVIRRNATALGLSVEIVQADATTFPATRPAAYDVVFAAPPYPLDLSAVFAALLSSGAAARGGLYVLQHPTGFELSDLPPALTGAEIRVKKYGSNSLTLVRVPSAPGKAADAAPGGGVLG